MSPTKLLWKKFSIDQTILEVDRKIPGTCISFEYVFPTFLKAFVYLYVFLYVLVSLINVCRRHPSLSFCPRRPVLALRPFPLRDTPLFVGFTFEMGVALQRDSLLVLYFEIDIEFHRYALFSLYLK